MLTVDNDTEQLVYQIAQQTGLTAQNIVHEALISYIEDLQDGALAQTALLEIETGAAPLTLEELNVYLDSVS
jgi:predicted DNA-binding protein